MEVNLEALLGKVFTVYAVFWVVMIVTLFFGVGALLKKRERLLQKRQHDH